MSPKLHSQISSRALQGIRTGLRRKCATPCATPRDSQVPARLTHEANPSQGLKDRKARPACDVAFVTRTSKRASKRARKFVVRFRERNVHLRVKARFGNRRETQRMLFTMIGTRLWALKCDDSWHGHEETPRKFIVRLHSLYPQCTNPKATTAQRRWRNHCC